VIAQTRSELLKIRSTKTTIGLVLGMVALVLLFVLLTGLLSHVRDLTGAADQQNLFGIGSFAGLFSALAGVLLVTSEYRFGTIRPTFLFTPRRSTVVGGKVAAGLLAGLAFGVGALILSGRGIDLSLSDRDAALLTLGTLVGSALWGAIGVGLAAIIRNQVSSVIGLLAWGFVVESLLFALVPSVGRLTPGQAENAMLGMPTDHLLSPATGSLVLVAWAAALVAVGAALTAVRDVG
jgi:ABC-type transport system involved in multi-copper enzyme maturation permease subunit